MKFRVLAIIFVFLACVAVSKADIANWYCADDGDLVITCPRENVTWGEVGGEYTMDVTGSHNLWNYGHMVGWFETGANPDPTIKITNSLENDTDTAWTDYHINVYMDNLFSIVAGSASVSIPAPNDWSSVITPVAAGAFIDADGHTHAYKGTVDYYAGTPVGVGDTLEFTYKINFTGSPTTHYNYTQEMIPTPEPGTFVLLACGLVSLLVIRRRFV
jgi:hypothetical protein